MVSEKPSLATEVLVQLMSDNPLPVFLNYGSLHVSLSLSLRQHV